jgi:DNA sulfur modification protein DndD
MKVELLGWSSRGLRCPDVDIELGLHGKVAPVSLIQMPNGTGKTTTLELLTAALDGTAEKWSAEKVRGYQRPREDSPKGEFIAKLLVDERPLTFELTLDYLEGHARYRTTNPGSGGVTTGHHPTAALHRFLTPQFISLFVFDGEFADRLLDPSRSEAKRAIDALCQLYLLDDIGDFADQEWQRATRKRTATTPAGLANYQAQRTQIANRLANLQAAQEKARKEKTELDETIAKLSEAIGTHIARLKGVSDRYETAQRQLSEAENKVTSASAQLMQVVRLPYALHLAIPTALVELKDNLDRLQLPENTSAQFFEELMEEPLCICGREMTDDARKEVEARAKQYLGTEEAGVINALKKDIDQVTAPSEELSGHLRLLEHVKAVSAAVRERQQAEGTVRTLKQQLIEQGDEQVRKWEEDLQGKQAQLRDIQALLKNTAATGDDSEDSEKTLSIALLTRRLADIDSKISEITKTVTLHEQTKLIRKVVSEARELARDNICALILTECNKTLRKVLSHDPLQLDRIDSSLHLAHQTGASVGQTLAVGYTFLMTALKRGQNDFPLIVDSPANPLDVGRRRQIGALIPELCSQFVGFTISTERLGFVSALEDTKCHIKYLTLFRRTEGAAKLMTGLPAKGVTRTANAVLVDDRDYFHAFDVEQEVD